MTLFQEWLLSLIIIVAASVGGGITLGWSLGFKAGFAACSEIWNGRWARESCDILDEEVID